jgi:predicted 2-oxoglutarate/Fe(II)-dependent dioxygenase YbiX
MIYQEKIFTKEECQTIIQYHKKYTELEGWFPSKLIDGQRIKSNQNLMSYEVYTILNNNETNWFYDKLINWFSEVSEVKIDKTFKTLICTLHRYTIGDHFTKHIDLIKGYEERRYNLGIQLNDDYDGGEYITWDDSGNEIIINKEPGTALGYHCRIWHEIKEITNGERWSIVMPIEKSQIIQKLNLI